MVAKHWAENRKRYLLSLLAIGGLLIGWYCFILTMDRIDPLGVFFQYTAYFVGLYFVGCLFASTLFAELHDKTTGIAYLSLPASQLEKLLCALFFGVFLFFIAFTLLFYLVDIPMVQLGNRLIEKYPRTWPGTNQFVPPLAVYNVFTGKAGAYAEAEYHIFLLGYFPIQSAFLLGSVYFRRFAFIKTTVAVLLFIFILVGFVTKLIPHALPSGWDNDFLQWDQFEAPFVKVREIRLPAWIEGVIVFLMRWSLPFVFWIITYFRLKEKEV